VNSILNIVNGDSAVKIMRQAGISGDFLPWRDILHEGPVPADLSLEELSLVRADYIGGQSWDSQEDIKQSFIDRDNGLKEADNYKRVILWFEHDLYDQLQILQILDWFYKNSFSKSRLSIICTENYLGVQSAEQIHKLLDYEQPITEEQFKLASRGWAAFRAESPEPWHALLDMDTSALPFLKDAVVRMLEEYPSCSDGLSRTARQALEIIAEGESPPGRIFGANQKREQRVFMGDLSFWGILRDMLQSNPPLLALPPGKQLSLPPEKDQALSLTTAGESVLSRKTNWLDIAEVDRWIGGVHLDTGNIWCWNPDSGTLTKRPLEL
jgi:hypothetical protein